MPNWFAARMHVSHGRGGNLSRAVRSPERASELLLKERPDGFTREHVAVREVVLRALKNADAFGRGDPKGLTAAAADIGSPCVSPSRTASENARPAFPYGIQGHAKAATRHGATLEEVMEAI